VARALIGDEALREDVYGNWSFRYDLATVWQAWKGLPFVFGMWIIHQNATSPELQPLLNRFLSEMALSEPRFIDKGEVTANVFAEDSRILEINSKSGLYPLYMAYSIYRTRVKNSLFSVSSIEDEQQIWDKVVAENIFVICKTPMAKSITKRTLIGFRKAKVNTRYFEDLINQIKNKPEHFIKQVDKFVSERTGIKNMKFNAIVGNPPYQVMDGGAQASSVPVYQYFVSIAKKVQPNFISMIMPARWYAGGRGLDDFRADMLSDKTIRSLHDYPKASDLFSNVGSKVDYAIS
jgi:L-rhamnose mutarotase